MAEIAFVTTISEKPSFYIQEMEVGEFFKQPGSEMIQALLLRFRPLNMDVLPLYVVLMAFLPLVLQLARLHRDLPLVLSIGLYIVTLRYDLHPAETPEVGASTPHARPPAPTIPTSMPTVLSAPCEGPGRDGTNRHSID